MSFKEEMKDVLKVFYVLLLHWGCVFSNCISIYLFYEIFNRRFSQFEKKEILELSVFCTQLTLTHFALKPEQPGLSNSIGLVIVYI